MINVESLLFWNAYAHYPSPKLLKECLSFIGTLTRNYKQNYLYWHTWLIHLITLPYFQNVLCESCAEKVEFALSCYVWIKVGASFQLHYWNMNFCFGFNMYCVNYTPSTTKMIVYIRILFKLMCTNWTYWVYTLMRVFTLERYYGTLKDK